MCLCVCFSLIFLFGFLRSTSSWAPNAIHSVGITCINKICPLQLIYTKVDCRLQSVVLHQSTTTSHWHLPEQAGKIHVSDKCKFAIWTSICAVAKRIYSVFFFIIIHICCCYGPPLLFTGSFQIEPNIQLFLSLTYYTFLRSPRSPRSPFTRSFVRSFRVIISFTNNFLFAPRPLCMSARACECASFMNYVLTYYVCLCAGWHEWACVCE